MYTDVSLYRVTGGAGHRASVIIYRGRMDRNADRVRAGLSRGSVILWIRKEEPSGGGVDGSRLLGGREGGGGERG